MLGKGSRKVRNEVQNQAPAFDISKVEEKLKNIKTLDDISGKDGLLSMMFKSTIERILKGEQEAHLGYEPYKKEKKSPGRATTNSRNGYSQKTLQTSSGAVSVDIPRDREGSFEPKLLARHQSFDPLLEKQITGMYTRGMTVRDIQSQLEEFYGTEVSPALISKITDHVLDGAAEWQARPLESVYAVVFMDAIFYKTRVDGKVVNRAAYTCLGIDLEGQSDILGTWISESEGAHFWLNVMTELKGRGVQDILIACVDGLKGFPEAIESAYPKALTQLCVVHQIRNSLKYVGSKYQKEFLADLKPVYRAPSLEIAEAELDKLEAKWGKKYPIVVGSWRNNWKCLSTFFQFPEPIRRMIYTTNAVENVHRQFRKVTHSKGQFPTDQALIKMLYLAGIQAKKKMKTKQNWAEVAGQLRLIFGERVPLQIRV